MKRGFTILELLVASLLLGMLVTVLTMIFNQSSIAWRTGLAGVADLDDARCNMAELREEADNVYVWESSPYLLQSPWDEKGGLRARAISVEGGSSAKRVTASFSDSMQLRDIKNPVSVGSGAGSGNIDTYTVNVMSAGPDREFDTYDDIWSFPDDFE